jgi:hemolysin III
MIFDWHQPISALTHLFWGLIGIPSWYYLVRDEKNKIPLSVFMFAAELCYFSSFLYHAVSYPWIHVFALCDHICIFLLIAGTYTPIVWQFCARGRVRTLCFVWGLAFLGIVLRLVTGHPHEFVYLAIGWGMILASYDLMIMLFHKDFLLIILGAVFYSVGAVLEYLAVPTIIEHWIEHHEVFHVFVMAGTSCHYLFMRRELNDRPKIRNQV